MVAETGTASISSSWTKGSTSSTGPKSADVTSDPALNITARGEEAVNSPLGATHNTPTTPTINPLSRTHARTHWPEPPMATISSWGYNELITIEKLVVGRVYDGKITFLALVDLARSGSTKQLSADFVRFEDNECSVCPDLGNVDESLPGPG